MHSLKELLEDIARQYGKTEEMLSQSIEDMGDSAEDISGTTFYHEYEHYIVYEEGWISNGKHKYIQTETADALKTDIIDGVTNGKYQPGYGHINGYWSANSNRLSNEAFAQIFSAQMTGDEVELNKMKQLMPKI